jgi:hypothetical protein
LFAGIPRPTVGADDLNTSDRELFPRHRATSAEFFNSPRPIHINNLVDSLIMS